MNRNIEVINEHLWAVNQEYVKAGYIKELSSLPGTTPEKNNISLTDQGILILNKNAQPYDLTKKMVIRIMGYTDEQSKLAHEEMLKIEKPDTYEKMYLNVLEFEIKRRCVRADYLKSISKPTFKDKIQKIYRKVVKICHPFKQG